MPATFFVGDAIEVMASLPPGSVDLVLTSPPFLALRSYLPAEHPDKGKEGGSQRTPAEYIDWLIEVVEACDRVLAPHGSLCIELGDTYSGGTGNAIVNYQPGDFEAGERASGETAAGYEIDRNEKYERIRGEGFKQGVPNLNRKKQGSGTGWPLGKSLSLIPELFRFSLVYGSNPLTGRETERWRLRNVVRWVRPNPPVGELGDKFRPATSELMIFCHSAQRYFDLDSVRTPHASAKDAARIYTKRLTGHVDNRESVILLGGNPAGAPPLDWWSLPPGGYDGAHYAVWPPELLIKPIKAMTPEKVCRTCREPARRISLVTRTIDGEPSEDIGRIYREEGQGRSRAPQGIGHRRYATERSTQGWTDCSHDDYRPGLVLDPFAGSGTTLAVATGHGRDAIGIDIDERNFDLALGRVGPFLLTRGEIGKL